MTDNVLHFVHSARPPTSDVRVFDSLSREFLGAEFTFRVIGSSHYVSAPAYDFHELSSCDPVDGDDVTTLRLDGVTTADAEGSTGADATSTDDAGAGSTADVGPAAAHDARTAAAGTARTRLEHATDDLRCETVVERRPLAAFPADRSFDLAYRFDEDAVTTVEVGTDGYETYHTYPEFDLALYTRTVFGRVPVAASAADAADRRCESRGRPTD